MAGESSLKWPTAEVEAISPDAVVLCAAQELATSSRWVRLGREGAILWGECRGTGRALQQPYRVAVDQTSLAPDPAHLHCSCPSRKRPCKHVLGLLLLAGLAQLEEGVPGADPLAWVQAARQVERRAASRPRDLVGSEARQAKSPGISAGPSRRRASSRDQRIGAGLADLECWMSDLLIRGLASYSVARADFRLECERMASRMIAAQGPAIARRLKKIGAAVNSSTAGWEAQVLEELAMLQLAVESFRSLHSLSVEEQADLWTFIGRSRRREEALRTPGIADRWLVMGATLDHEPPLKVSRTWLTGLKTARRALLLEYFPETAGVGQPLAPGIELTAELHFFPGAAPLRAVCARVDRSRRGTPPTPDNIGVALRRYAANVAVNPWLELYPMFLAGVVPVRVGEQWRIIDHQWQVLPLLPDHPRAMTGWRLLALGGANPIDLFGEWNGSNFRPLTAFIDQRGVELPN